MHPTMDYLYRSCIQVHVVFLPASWPIVKGNFSFATASIAAFEKLNQLAIKVAMKMKQHSVTEVSIMQ